MNLTFIDVQEALHNNYSAIYNTEDQVIKMKQSFDSFIVRSFNGLLYTHIEILANLYLVKRGGRLAYLFESSEYPSSSEILLEDIKKFYPEFRRTLENKIAGRYLYHLEDLPIKSPEQNYDYWLGSVLDFDCPGDLIYHNQELTYAIKYYITDDQVKKEIFTEICRENVGLTKLNSWNVIFKNSRWSIQGNVEPLIAEQLIIENIIEGNVDFIEEYQNAVIDWLEGSGLEFIADTLIEYGIEETFTKYSAYLVMEALIEKYGLFHPLYPLNNDENREFSQLRRKLWKDTIHQKRVRPFRYFFTLLHNPLIEKLYQDRKISSNLIYDKVISIIINKLN